MAKKATLLMREAVFYHHRGNPARAAQLAQEAKTWAEQHYQPRLAGKAHRLLKALNQSNGLRSPQTQTEEERK